MQGQSKLFSEHLDEADKRWQKIMFPKEVLIKVKQQKLLVAFYIECSAVVEGCLA